MNILRYISIPVRLYRKYHYHKIFGHIGRKSSVDSPLRLQGPENIYIGDNVGVHYKTWLAALPLTQMGGGKTFNFRWLCNRRLQSYMGNSFHHIRKKCTNCQPCLCV